MNKQELERKIEHLEAQLQDLKKHVTPPPEDLAWRNFEEAYELARFELWPDCPAEVFCILDQHLAEKVFHAWKTYQFRVSLEDPLWGVKEEARKLFFDKFHKQLQAEVCGDPHAIFVDPDCFMLESAFEQTLDDDDLMEAIKKDLDSADFRNDCFNELIEAYFIYYENKYFTGGNL